MAAGLIIRRHNPLRREPSFSLRTPHVFFSDPFMAVPMLQLFLFVHRWFIGGVFFIIVCSACLAKAVLRDCAVSRIS